MCWVCSGVARRFLCCFGIPCLISATVGRLVCWPRATLLGFVGWLVSVALPCAVVGVGLFWASNLNRAYGPVSALSLLLFLLGAQFCLAAVLTQSKAAGKNRRRLRRKDSRNAGYSSGDSSNNGLDAATPAPGPGPDQTRHTEAARQHRSRRRR